MPTYQYQCGDCGYLFNIIFRYDQERKLPVCDNCQGSRIFQVYSSTPIVFKAKDFYSTNKGNK